MSARKGKHHEKWIQLYPKVQHNDERYRSNTNGWFIKLIMDEARTMAVQGTCHWKKKQAWWSIGCSQPLQIPAAHKTSCELFVQSNAYTLIVHVGLIAAIQLYERKSIRRNECLIVAKM